MRDVRGNVKQALQALRTNEEDLDLVNISIGFPPKKNDGLARNLNQIVEEDILPVVAAGNQGPEYFSITSPGISRRAITIGSVDFGKNISRFSSRGPTSHEFRVKPDVVGVGENVEAPVSHQSTGDIITEVKSGTSMSTAVVSGSIGLIRASKPSWDAESVKNSLITTAEPLHKEGQVYDVYTQGAGLVQTEKAINTDIIILDSVIDFQHVQSGSRIKKEIRIENISNTAHSLQVRASLHEIQNNKEHSADVDIEPDTITVPANSVDSIYLDIDTSDHYGIHSGRISYENINTNEQFTSIFGYVP
jgi:hypothetical protein